MERFLKIWNTFLSNKPCKSTHFTSLFARYYPIIQNCIKRTRWYTFSIHFLLHKKPKYYNSTFNPNRSLDRFGTTRDWKDINWQKQQRPLLIVLDEPLKIKIKSFKRLSRQNNKNISRVYARVHTIVYIFCCHKCHTTTDSHQEIKYLTRIYYTITKIKCEKRKNQDKSNAYIPQISIFSQQITGCFPKNDGLFYQKQRVVLPKMTACFTQNDVLFYPKRRVVLPKMTACFTYECDTCDSKNHKLL